MQTEDADLPLADEVGLADELKAILPDHDPDDGEYRGMHDDWKLLVRRLPDGTGFELEYGSMYTPPVFNLSHMKALAALFGVADADLDVDDYSKGGCETCDYYSDYGHTVQLRRPTKRVAELEALVGTDLYDRKGR